MSALLDLSGRRVVVTGGKGFLGRFVCRELESHGADVRALGSADYNLVEQEDVRKLFRSEKPSVLIHLAAACGGIGANVENPGRFLYENAAMGLMLLHEAMRAEIDRFVLISTTCAYPRDAPLPLGEDSLWEGKPVGATGPYGMAKRLLHEACETYERQYGLDSVVLIPTNMYGPEDHFESESNHVIPALISRYCQAKADGKSEVVNWGSGSPTREFLYVKDAAAAIVQAARMGGGAAPVNLGTGVETSIADLTQTISDLVGYEGKVSWDTSKPDGQPRRFLSTQRASERFDWHASTSLRDGLESTIRWYQEKRG